MPLPKWARELPCLFEECEECPYWDGKDCRIEIDEKEENQNA